MCLSFPSNLYPTENNTEQYWTWVNCRRLPRPGTRKHLWFSCSWQPCSTNSNSITGRQQGGLSSAWWILLLSTPHHRSIVPLFQFQCLTCISQCTGFFSVSICARTNTDISQARVCVCVTLKKALLTKVKPTAIWLTKEVRTHNLFFIL